MSAKRAREESTYALMDACYSGDPHAVISLLQDGAYTYALERDGKTILMIACYNSLHGDVIMAYILPIYGGFLIHSADRLGNMALTHAVATSNTSCVEQLIRAGANVNARNNNGSNALHTCCRQIDSRSAIIASMLISSGIDIEAQTTFQLTPLHIAIRYNSLDVVDVLLYAGANINAVDCDGSTCLMMAVQNRTHGKLIFDRLVAAGANVNAKRKDGITALHYAQLSNGEMLQWLSKYYVVNHLLGYTQPQPSCPDIIGVMHESQRYGAVYNNSCLSKAIISREYTNVNWALSRATSLPCFDGSQQDLFVAMSTCADTPTWKMVALRWPAQHPTTGSTLLHIAVSSGNLDAVKELTTHNINPLIPNVDGKLAIDLTKDTTILAVLREFMKWKPKRNVTQWYGPYFTNRARAFVLVCQRWRRNGVRFVQKDIVEYILQLVAAVEYTWVKKLQV